MNKNTKQQTQKTKNKKLGLILGCVFGTVGVAGGIAMMLYSCSTQQLTLIFDVGDATVKTGSTQVKIDKGVTFGSINKPEVVKSQYLFEGWYKDRELTQKISDTESISSSTTIYLKMVSDGCAYVDFSAGETKATLVGNTIVAVTPDTPFGSINKPVATLEDKVFKYWESVSGEEWKESTVIKNSTRLVPHFALPTASDVCELHFDKVGKSTYDGTTIFSVQKGTIFQKTTKPTALLTGKIFNKWQYKDAGGNIVDVPDEWTLPEGIVHIYPSFSDVDMAEKITISVDGVQYWLTNPASSSGDLIFVDKDGNELKKSRTTFNETITIGEKVQSIDIDFLANCTSFNNGGTSTDKIPLVLPANITTIGSTFLHNCTSFNQEVDLSQCTKLNKINTSFMHNCISFNSKITMPSSYESSTFAIGPNFMFDCYVFNQPITLPEKLTTIPSCFLEGCIAFNQTITFPTNVNQIGPYFMARCSKFNNGGSGNALTIPTNVTQINDNFLYNCSTFNNQIVLPSGLTKIGNYCLYECNNFVNGGKANPFTIPTTVTSIGNYFLYDSYSFNNSLGLDKLTGLTSIGSYFLYYCSSLNTALTIPSTVTSVGKWFMYTCRSMLATITINCDVTAFSDDETEYTLAFGSSEASAFITGSDVQGTCAIDFKTNFPESSSWPYRKYKA